MQIAQGHCLRNNVLCMRTVTVDDNLFHEAAYDDVLRDMCGMAVFTRLQTKAPVLAMISACYDPSAAKAATS